MRMWHEEPGAREWREAADAADRERGVVVPVDELPGLLKGREELELAVRLLADPENPGALTKARSALRRALTVIPQSKPDQLCYEQRWRGRTRYNRKGNPPEVCSRPTCGRCVPLREHQERSAEL